MPCVCVCLYWGWDAEKETNHGAPGGAGASSLALKLTPLIPPWSPLCFQIFIQPHLITPSTNLHQLFQKSDTREVSSGKNYSFWDSFKPAGAQTRNLQGKQSVQSGSTRCFCWRMIVKKSDDIVFPLSLAAKCKPLSKSSQKMDKTQLDSFDIAKNANDWKRRGCRFSIHWQRKTVVNFSNRLIWKPRWSFWGSWVGTLVGGHLEKGGSGGALLQLGG